MKKSIVMLMVCFLVTFPAWANSQVQEDNKVLLTRIQHRFDTTLEIMKTVLQKNGFRVAHVQRCDGGLKEMGYETDKYRVIFFGRFREVREVSQKHAELIPFIPFKLLVYAEGDETVVSTLNPESLKGKVSDPGIAAKLKAWKKEFIEILEQAHKS